MGQRIRQARLERGLTLRQLETLADLSATHLSDIERGQASPTLGALMKIAAALGRDPAQFVDSDPRSEVLHLPPEACRTFSPASGVTVEILTLGIPGSRMLAYRLRFDPGEALEVLISAREVTAEGIHVVWLGAADVWVKRDPVRLGTGDALQAGFVRPHRLRSTGEGPTVLIVVATHALTFVPPS